jgi:hypothetical protein
MSEAVIGRNPYWSLAAAAGAGYLLGGGFPPRPFVGLLLAAGGRMAMSAVLQELIASQAKSTSALRPTNRSADAPTHGDGMSTLDLLPSKDANAEQCAAEARKLA